MKNPDLSAEDFTLLADQLLDRLCTTIADTADQNKSVNPPVICAVLGDLFLQYTTKYFGPVACREQLASMIKIVK